MSTDHWHVSHDHAARYADGTLPEADAWSLEKHLEGCGGCARRVSAAVGQVPAAALILAQVRETVLGEAALEKDAVRGVAVARGTALNSAGAATAPAAAAPAGTAPAGTAPAGAWPKGATSEGAVAHGAVAHDAVPHHAVPHHAVPHHAGRRAAAVLGNAVPDDDGVRQQETAAPRPPVAAPPAPRARLWSSFLARALWAAGPAVRGAWLPAVLLVALGALGLAYGADVEAARPLLLVLAPVVPVAGVALSYGPYADPLHEIAAATPSGGLRLVLTRTAAVLGVSLPLLTLTGLLLPASGAPGAAAWLLPGLALTLASLVLAGFVGCRAATAVIGGGWLGAVLVPALTASGGPALAGLAEQLGRCLDGPVAQGGWAAAAVLSSALLAARRSAYDHLPAR
ncbi:zf-HC2 domain-containing protein [Streptomyces sp. NPDC001381]|uniref:zf-HC2 domain-containing protein n=1 Tax=Streptomyces sp. NPDC001381 TaxID=3364567 RepID=UPI0036CC7F28